MPFCDKCTNYYVFSVCGCTPFKYTEDLETWSTIWARGIDQAVEKLAEDRHEGGNEENIFEEPPIFYIDGQFKMYQAGVEY